MNCPTCGQAVRVNDDGDTKHFIPMEADELRTENKRLRGEIKQLELVTPVCQCEIPNQNARLHGGVLGYDKG